MILLIIIIFLTLVIGAIILGVREDKKNKNDKN